MPRVAVVVTAANDAQADAYRAELRARRAQLPTGAVLLAVADPSGSRIGSGGGTLNALVAVHDELHDADAAWAQTTLVVVVHSGGDSQRSPAQSVCGKAWACLPTASMETPFDLLFAQLLKLCDVEKAGLVVACSDVLLLLPELEAHALSELKGVTGLAILADGKTYGPKHGVYVAAGGSTDGAVACGAFLQKASFESLVAAGAVDANGNVALDSGAVYFDAPTTFKLLHLGLGTLKACTYRGHDYGLKAMRIELYSDVLIALKGAGMDGFGRYAALQADEKDAVSVSAFRSALWEALSATQLNVLTPKGGRFAHLGTTREFVELVTTGASVFRDALSLVNESRCHFTAAPESARGEYAVSVNSVLGAARLGDGCVVEHCHFEGATVGAGSLVSGFRASRSLNVTAGMLLQQLALVDGRFVVVAFGVRDEMKQDLVYAGEPLRATLTRLRVSRDDLWDANDSRTLWSARLFVPHEDAATAAAVGAFVAGCGSADAAAAERIWRSCEPCDRLSMRDVLSLGDKKAEFKWRRSVAAQVTAAKLADKIAALRLGEDDTALHDLRDQARGCVDDALAQSGADVTALEPFFDVLEQLASTAGASTASASTGSAALAALAALALRCAAPRHDALELSTEQLRVLTVPELRTLRTALLDEPSTGAAKRCAALYLRAAAAAAESQRGVSTGASAPVAPVDGASLAVDTYASSTAATATKIDAARDDAPRSTFLWAHRVDAAMVATPLDATLKVAPAVGGAAEDGPEAAEATWDVIVVTADTLAQAEAYAWSLRGRRRTDRLRGGGEPRVISVSTKIHATSHRLGSGGATLHALLRVAEELCAALGRDRVDGDVLAGKRILVLHSGAQEANGGALWLPVPLVDASGTAALDSVDAVLAAADAAARFQGRLEAGVWIASGELVLSPTAVAALGEQRWDTSGLTVLAVACAIAVAEAHGVFALEQGAASHAPRVSKFAYQSKTLYDDGFALQPQDDANFAVACGLMRLCPDSAAALLEAHAVRPFSSCTDLGVDDGLEPEPFSLFLDVLPALLPESAGEAANVKALRDVLRGRVGLNAQCVYGEQFELLKRPADYARIARYGGDALVLNSEVRGADGIARLGRACVVANASLCGDWSIGEKAVAIGLRGAVTVPANVVAQRVALECGGHALIAAPWCALEGLLEALAANKVGLRNVWAGGGGAFEDARLFPVVQDEDGDALPLWLFAAASAPAVEHAAVSESAFGGFEVAREVVEKWLAAPRVSYAGALRRCDVSAEHQWAVELTARHHLHAMAETLQQRRMDSLTCRFEHCAALSKRPGAHGLLDRVLCVLEAVALSADLDVAARALACCAEALVCFTGDKSTLVRSGPARNAEWAEALSLLDSDAETAVLALRVVRRKWLASAPPGVDAERAVRCARHYDAAAARLVRRAVAQSISKPNLERSFKRTRDDGFELFTATAPCRIDVAGGWSDTPPIAFELGGSVANVAVLLDGTRQIGATCRRVPLQQGIVVVLEHLHRADERVFLSALCDFGDRSNPQAPAALIKCCLVVDGVVDARGAALAQQLRAKIGAGLEIRTWSRVPTGSGLGTSSILAACVLAALRGATVRGYAVDRAEIVNAVMAVEQELTTGGGWQDNVGGVYGGAKLATSPAALPLVVETSCISMARPAAFDGHLVLAYTGRARLAKTLLQTVLRRWHARSAKTVETCAALVANAHAAADALRRGDVAGVGGCLDAYWQHKRAFAEGAEPPFVRQILKALRPLIHGAALCGAGGGGFLVLVTQEADAVDALRKALVDFAAEHDPSLANGITFHRATMDHQGLTLTAS